MATVDTTNPIAATLIALAYDINNADQDSRKAEAEFLAGFFTACGGLAATFESVQAVVNGQGTTSPLGAALACIVVTGTDADDNATRSKRKRLLAACRDQIAQVAGIACTSTQPATYTATTLEQVEKEQAEKKAKKAAKAAEKEAAERAEQVEKEAAARRVSWGDLSQGELLILMADCAAALAALGTPADAVFRAIGREYPIGKADPVTSAMPAKPATAEQLANLPANKKRQRKAASK